MSIENCAKCGGTHYGSNKCPYIEAPCVICGTATVMACSDCAIDSGGRKSVHICGRRECREQHETAVHHAVKVAQVDVYEEQKLYTDGFKAGYAQAVADADATLRKHGDDRQTRLCRRDVLALVSIPYNPDEVMPRPDWTKHSVKGPTPLTPPVAASGALVGGMVHGDPRAIKQGDPHNGA